MRRVAITIGVIVGVLSPVIAAAFVPTVTPDGHAVKWGGARKYDLAGNPQNRSGISDRFFYDAVVRGLQRWQGASAGAIGFDYWQGKDNDVYEPNAEYNGLSSIFFASERDGGTQPGQQVIGLTQVWYDLDNGKILEADIVLNDVDYVFTSNPADTSGTGSGQPYGGYNNEIFLENVVTHEIGHALGLSHSGALQSTMLFLESPEQAHLSCDDILGIRSLYETSSVSSGSGELRGRIVDSGGDPVVGAQVVVVSESRGAAVAYGLTSSSGNYRVRNLEPGRYSLMVEPYYAGAGTLPSYYSGMNASVCGGGTFSRTFLAEPNGYHLKRLAVSGGLVTQAGDLAVRCSGSKNAAVSGPFGASNAGDAPSLERAAGDTGFSVVDRVTVGGSLLYRVQVTGGQVEVRALAYSLYSPVGVAIELLNSSLQPVNTQDAHPVYSGASGFSNYDGALVASGLPSGTYYVRATAQYVSSSRYPAASLSMDYAPFVMLTGRKSTGSLPFESHLSFNARCRMDEDFAAYHSPGGEPPRADEDSDGLGFCGTVASGGSGGNRRPPAPPTAVLGWFLPWALGLLAVHGMRLTARRAGRRLAVASARG
ncbi:MAG: carboxypeptidase regulatory-like domain-containing protein [Bdellovibrionales bacterium]|nr:carboxypeptidase regulatory-like domain-containing protein [Bdellovibrionales bacterium]